MCAEKDPANCHRAILILFIYEYIDLYKLIVNYPDLLTFYLEIAEKIKWISCWVCTAMH